MPILPNVTSDDPASFGQWVKRTRLSEGLNQQQLAQRMGLGAPYISQIETGDRPPTEAVAIAFAKAMGIDTDFVLFMAGFKDEPAPPKAKSPYREKLDALLASLSPDEQEEAIEMLQAYAQVKKRRKRASGRPLPVPPTPRTAKAG